MTCYHPLQAYKLLDYFTETGKSLIRFSRPFQYRHEELQLPCGQCIGCRLERSRQWAVRCLHESRLYSDNCFITLTFSDDYLFKRSNPYTVDVRDFQLFMKRLRRRVTNPLDKDMFISEDHVVRFFHCGEYGDRYERPHYHACLFNFDFSDKVIWKVVNDCKLYTSQLLSELWPYGFSTIGNVTFDSAAYVARYIMKKVNGKPSFHHYNKIDYSTGEVLFTRKPEYVTMSRRNGIGKEWFDMYFRDVYVYGRDSVVMNGRKIRPPKYYDSLYEIMYPSDFESIKSARKSGALLHSDDCTPERLLVREKCKHMSIRKLPRIVD